MKITRSWKRTLLAGSAAVVLVASGCSLLPGGLGEPADEEIDDAIDDVVDSAEELAETSEDDGVEAEEASEGLDPLPVVPQEVGTTVHIGGLEYTIDSLDAIDLDAEAGHEMRIQGAQVVLTGSVVNPGGDTATPNAPFALEWEDPATGHSFEAGGRISGTGVPSGGSGPLEVEITLNPDQLETFHQDSAVVFVGTPERSRAQAPLGDKGDLITRIPVPQPGLIGETFDVGGQVAVAIQRAELRWDFDRGTEDGTGLLELEVEVRNDSDGQRCWSRGTGNNFALMTSDGTDTVDLSMSDRGCVASGDSTVSLTGLVVHEDYAGDYTLVLTYDIPGTGDYEVPIEFTMVTEPAVLPSER